MLPLELQVSKYFLRVGFVWSTKRKPLLKAIGSLILAPSDWSSSNIEVSPGTYLIFLFSPVSGSNIISSAFNNETTGYWGIFVRGFIALVAKI